MDRGCIAALVVAATVLVACTGSGSTASEPSTTPSERLPANGLIAYTTFFGALVIVDPADDAPASPDGEPMPGEPLSSPAWSPDGRTLAATRSPVFGDMSSIVLVDPETGEPRPITNGGDDRSPVWSPDGDSVAFLRFARGRADLWVVDIAGPRARRLVGGGGPWNPYVDPNALPAATDIVPNVVHRAIAWSPDGSTIAFSVDPFGDARILIVRDDGQVESTVDGRYPTWSPDGGRLAYSVGVGAGSEIVTSAPDGSERVRLTNNGGEDTMPQWSPDGTRILYVSDAAGPPGKLEVWSMDPSGSDAEQLSTNASELTGHTAWQILPTWSPDGQRVLYLDQIFSGGAVDQWPTVIDADGAGLVTLAFGEASAAAWQPVTG